MTLDGSLLDFSWVKKAEISLRKRTDHVTFVGGHDRIEREIIPFGAELGIEVVVHNGQTRGHGAERLVTLIHRTDLVIIITGTNSHNAMHIAKREAAKVGARVRIVRACGTQTARDLLMQVAACRRAVNRDVSGPRVSTQSMAEVSDEPCVGVSV